jgi:hypothetical protein
MADSVSVYTLGMGGVDVDTDPVLMKDEQVRQAQNAEHRAVAGRKGAVGNRDGYARFITNPLDGAILGGIEMPVADTGGAPASGGGGNNTGDALPGVTGDNLGPGLTVDPSVNAGGSNPPGPGLGQDNLLFGGARLLLIGLEDTSVGTTRNGHGWFVTSKKGADNALISITGTNGAVIGPPGHPTDIIRPGGTDYVNHGQNPYTYANGKLVYGHSFVQVSTTSDVTRTHANLYVYDGINDSLVATFPHNELLPGENYRTSVVNVIVKYGDGNTVFVSLADSIPIAGGFTGYHGRIFKVTGLDTGVYVVTEQFNTAYAGNTVFTAGDKNTNSYVPYSMEFFGGFLWVGMWRGHFTLDQDQDPFVFKLNVETDPPLVSLYEFAIADHTSTKISDASVMKRFNGSLYVGTRTAYNKSGGTTAAFAQLYRLDPDTTFTAVYDLDTAFTGAAVLGNLVSSMAVFGTNLYFAVWNATAGDGAQIIKYDGTTFTSVLTLTNANSPLNLGIDDGVLYAFGRKAAGTNALYWTENGTSWTDVGSVMTVGGGAVNTPMNFLYGLDQS